MAIPEISKKISGACAPDRLKPRPPVTGTTIKAPKTTCFLALAETAEAELIVASDPHLTYYEKLGAMMSDRFLNNPEAAQEHLRAFLPLMAQQGKWQFSLTRPRN